VLDSQSLIFMDKGLYDDKNDDHDELNLVVSTREMLYYFAHGLEACLKALHYCVYQVSFIVNIYSGPSRCDKLSLPYPDKNPNS